MTDSLSAVIFRQEQTLKIELPAAFDRRNAKEVLNSILANFDDKVRRVLFDAEKLRTVSADGLDVILEMKKRCPDVLLDHARIGICDTLALYGFDHFLTIQKQYRFLSVKDFRIIGQGGHGTIYQSGEDTIVKVYRDHSALEVIERERQYARCAFLTGIPTAIAYDIVETEYGHGVLFEMIDGMTLGRYLQQHPDELENCSVRFADLLHTLHTTYADPALYKDIRDVYLERAERAKTFLSEKEGEKLKRIIRALPTGSGMIHGDYHPNNVMIDSAGELMLIDMADISRGNGFFDLGGTYMLMHHLSGVPLLRWIVQRITALSPSANRKMWSILMRQYFSENDPSSLEDTDRCYRAFSQIRIAASLGMDSSRSPLVTRLMTLYTKALVLPKTDRYIRLFSSLSK